MLRGKGKFSLFVYSISYRSVILVHICERRNYDMRYSWNCLKFGSFRISVDEFVIFLYGLFYMLMIAKCLCQATNIFNSHGMFKGHNHIFKSQSHSLSLFVNVRLSMNLMAINLIRVCLLIHLFIFEAGRSRKPS